MRPADGKPTTRASGVDEYAGYLTKRFTKHGLSAERLLSEIRAQGFTGSVYMVRRFLRRLRSMRSAASAATLRFETAPGQQAQCDWAYCGRHPDRSGRMISIYAFVMVLGFSRALFVKFTTSMRLAALIECHREAFAFFGGIPQQVLYDNMKQVRFRNAIMAAADMIADGTNEARRSLMDQIRSAAIESPGIAASRALHERLRVQFGKDASKQNEMNTTLKRTFDELKRFRQEIQMSDG